MTSTELSTLLRKYERKHQLSDPQQKVLIYETQQYIYRWEQTRPVKSLDLMRTDAIAIQTHAEKLGSVLAGLKGDDYLRSILEGAYFDAIYPPEIKPHFLDLLPWLEVALIDIAASAKLTRQRIPHNQAKVSESSAKLFELLIRDAYERAVGASPTLSKRGWFYSYVGELREKHGIPRKSRVKR